MHCLVLLELLPVTTSRLRRPAAQMIGPTLEAQAAAPYRRQRGAGRSKPPKWPAATRPTIFRPTQVLPRSLHVKEVTFKSV